MPRATSKSQPKPGREGLGILAAVLLAGGVCPQTRATPEAPADRAIKVHADAKDLVQSHPNDAQRAWKLGRACFDLAEFASNATQRAVLAREGIAACEQALSLVSTSAPARYYLGMNRGQLARTTTLGALKLVDRMEQDFLAAREWDAMFDQAGPDRNLGLLYLQAPGWPVSVGNQGKARAHLGKAVELAPIYPENRLNLMEALAKWGDSEGLQKQFAAWTERRREMEQRFAGDHWYWDWRHWERRLDELRRHLPEPPPPLATGTD